MADELERIWKETVESKIRYYDGICLEGLRRPLDTSVRIAVDPIEILTNLQYNQLYALKHTKQLKRFRSRKVLVTEDSPVSTEWCAMRPWTQKGRT